MATDNERREVAYRLRNMSKYTNPDNVYDSLSQATGVDDVIDGNGSLVAYLADLIEPSIDRDALLELADECGDASRAYGYDGHELTSIQFANVARRIREALGVES